ncbi:MAG: translation elongation factor Ts [Actinobacteria bacterium]|nr:translation elongation factor Ts [Actinomycetota bacterium]
MEISAAQVRELRALTGSGMMDCKQALAEAGGDIVEATEILRRKGLAALKKKAARVAKEGVIDTYVHGGGRIGVMVEVNCETDFVARSEDFRTFAHDISLQVAAGNPAYISREDVPDNIVEKELEIYRAAASEEGKSDQILDKIAQGRLEKFFESVCLLEQPFVKNPDITIKDYLGELAAKLGENMGIRRFIRYELGEEI